MARAVFYILQITMANLVSACTTIGPVKVPSNGIMARAEVCKLSVRSTHSPRTRAFLASVNAGNSWLCPHPPTHTLLFFHQGLPSHAEGTSTPASSMAQWRIRCDRADMRCDAPRLLGSHPFGLRRGSTATPNMISKKIQKDPDMV